MTSLAKPEIRHLVIKSLNYILFMFTEKNQNFFSCISDTMSVHCLNLVTTTILRNQNHQLREEPHVYLRFIVFILRDFKMEEVTFSAVK